MGECGRREPHALELLAASFALLAVGCFAVGVILAAAGVMPVGLALAPAALLAFVVGVVILLGRRVAAS